MNYTNPLWYVVCAAGFAHAQCTYLRARMAGFLANQVAQLSSAVATAVLRDHTATSGTVATQASQHTAASGRDVNLDDIEYLSSLNLSFTKK